MNGEYRPCEVKGKQGIFHNWVQTATPIQAENLRGGAPAGQLMQVFAIIEYEDGSVDVAELKSELPDTKIIVYRQGACMPELKDVQSNPIKGY